MVAIIAKVTEACNSHCAYCDVVTKPHQQTATMTGAVLDGLYRRVNDYLAEDRSRSCEIVWHGGEPLLAGADFYTTAAELCERLCPTTRNKISHCLQTNLTQLTGDFIAPLRRLGITSVGTSYDPITGIRGPGRERRRSGVYNHQFMPLAPRQRHVQSGATVRRGPAEPGDHPGGRCWRACSSR